MAMGTRKKRERQEDLWLVSSEVVGPPAHAFYDRLNQILDHHYFDRRLAQLCRRYYKGRLGRAQYHAGSSERKYIREQVWREMDWRDREWFVANLEVDSWGITGATPTRI